jgi:chromatin remodeling complex protein RSC6
MATTKQKEKKQPAAFQKPVTVSEALAQIVGKGPMPRTAVVQKLWDYIKKNELQNPKNKREIIPDEKLAKVFGSKAPVDMFKMTRLISDHLS